MPAPKKKTAKTRALKPTKLDDQTSAQVIGEYLALGKVTETEIEALELDVPGPVMVDARGVAITFRISEALGVPDAFELAPRFQAAFADLRRLVVALHASKSATVELVERGAS